MPKQPLLVHLVFHPLSDAARELARHIHRQLNDDAVVPGLCVPTVFCPYDSARRPAEALRLDLAAGSFVVPLADDLLNLDDDWCKFVADTWSACENSPHRCVPMQLSSTAWPLDPRLSGVNFGRAFAQPEGAKRNAWVTRRLVIELCRFLRNMDPTVDGKAPLQLFLSHAKADLGSEPRVAQALVDYLKADQPVEAWVDSGDIETGGRFADAIDAGVRRTSLLAILTDNYSTREWCREEVMLAKEHERPITVVDALTSHEVRSFPFLENVPKIRWTGDAAACIDLLLKESLRILVTGKALHQSKQPGDTVFLRPPEPATVLGVNPGSVILYSDPPLGVGELKRLSKAKATFTTPLQRAGGGRPLEERLIALSMSESTDIAARGLDPLHLDQTMAELSRHLLIRGATLAYGGHTGPDGYTSKLFELVRTHNNQDGVKPYRRIINHRGWPLPVLPTAKRAELKPVATIEQLPRPSDIDESQDPAFIAELAEGFSADDSPERRYAWCRGMTEMRTFQVDSARSKVVARIVLGGVFGPTVKSVEGKPPQQKWYAGRMPGVLEEVLLSIKAGQPVFLIGAYGGAAQLAIDLLLGRPHPAARWDYQSKAPHAEEARKLYAARGQKWWYYHDEARLDGLAVDDPKSIVEFLSDAWKTPKPALGWETRINPLSRAANEELFTTPDLTRIVELVLEGMGKIKP
jgi:hypothetical protein